MAVGASFNGTYYRTLVAAWSGSAWALLPSPNNGNQNNFLDGVSCVAANSCIAVGNFYNGTNHRTLIESWNGSAWKLVTSPNNGTHDNFLDGVSCVSSTSCKAVGYYNNGTTYRTLIESWNGSAWIKPTSPNNGTRVNQLRGVSCVSPTSCKAVGDYWNGTSRQTLIESWNGSVWTKLTSPNNGASNNNYLYGVSCVSAPSCKAVGSYSNGYTGGTLIESWNGSAWTKSASPNITGGSGLLGVACVSSTSCMAVGSYGATCWTGMAYETIAEALIESWNGTAWAVISGSGCGDHGSYLSGVSCASTASCKAVGAFSSYPERTLIESYG